AVASRPLTILYPIILPVPPGPTLSPYTTLFRSHGAGPATAAAFSLLMLLGTQGQQFTFGELKDILEGAGFTRVEATATAGHHSIDRKSTRLNSSHDQISYAVFCLKKKKNKKPGS